MEFVISFSRSDGSRAISNNSELPILSLVQDESLNGNINEHVKELKVWIVVNNGVRQLVNQLAHCIPMFLSPFNWWSLGSVTL